MIGNVDLDLLEKTYQNARIGIIAIEEVLDKASSSELQSDLKRQLKDYEELADRSKEQLIKNGAEVKDKSLYDKTMLKGGIMMNTWMDSSDSRIAEMVMKGSTNGVTQMTKLLHDKVNADGISTQLASEFIQKEERNIEIMKTYL